MTRIRRDVRFSIDERQRAHLEKALRRAIATERSEVVRARTLVTTGYGDRAGGNLSEQGDDASARMTVLQELLDVILGD